MNSKLEHLITEERRITRVTRVDLSVESEIERAWCTVVKFVAELKAEIDRRISKDNVVEKMRKVFTKFESEALVDLSNIAKLSGRDNGSLEELQCQLVILAEQYQNTSAKDEVTKWLMICTKPNLYKNIHDILHFALCCFVKVPLEAPAESIGSIINQHGRKQRCSLSPPLDPAGGCAPRPLP